MWTKWISIISIFGAFSHVEGSGLNNCLHVNFTDPEIENLLGACEIEHQMTQFRLTTVNEVLSERDTSGVLEATGPGVFCSEINRKLFFDEKSIIKVGFYLTQGATLSNAPLKVSLQLLIGKEIYVDNDLSKYKSWNDLNLPFRLEEEYPNMKIRLFADLSDKDIFLLKYVEVLQTDIEDCNIMTSTPILIESTTTSTTTSTTPSTTPSTTTSTNPSTSTTEAPNEPQLPIEEDNNETLWMILALVSMAFCLVLCIFYGILYFRKRQAKNEIKSSPIATAN